MVVPRADIESFIAGHTHSLIRSGTEAILETIQARHLFIPRAKAETSPEFKQIIPYVAIRSADDYFLLTRTSKQTESRLHHKMSLGIGGHINPDTPAILGGLEKELDEEVAVERPFALQFVGLLNDDTTDVGRVHLGVVYVLDAPSRNVTVRETDKMSGSWVPRAALAESRDRMETWSQIVYDHFIAG